MYYVSQLYLIVTKIHDQNNPEEKKVIWSCLSYNLPCMHIPCFTQRHLCWVSPFSLTYVCTFLNKPMGVKVYFDWQFQRLNLWSVESIAMDPKWREGCEGYPLMAAREQRRQGHRENATFQGMPPITLLPSVTHCLPTFFTQFIQIINPSNGLIH